MAPCVLCASPEEMVHAASLRAIIAIEAAELLSSAPPRTLVLAVRDVAGLKGRADAVLDAELTDPEKFRESLEEH
jgi:hypothetical protein